MPNLHTYTVTSRNGSADRVATAEGPLDAVFRRLQELSEAAAGRGASYVPVGRLPVGVTHAHDCRYCAAVDEETAFEWASMYEDDSVRKSGGTT